MPRQMYFTGDSAPYSPASFKGGWDDTTQAVTMRLDSCKRTVDPSLFRVFAVTATETSTDPEFSVCVIRLVGGPLLAQNISGTMQVRVGTWESDEAADLYYRVYAYLTQGDTDLVRGVLINGYEESFPSNNEWPTDAKGRDLILSAAMTAVDCQDNDRLVVELGYVGRNLDSTEYAGALYAGCNFFGHPISDQVRDP